MNFLGRPEVLLTATVMTNLTSAYMNYNSNSKVREETKELTEGHNKILEEFRKLHQAYEEQRRINSTINGQLSSQIKDVTELSHSTAEWATLISSQLGYDLMEKTRSIKPDSRSSGRSRDARNRKSSTKRSKRRRSSSRRPVREERKPSRRHSHRPVREERKTSTRRPSRRTETTPPNPKPSPRVERPSKRLQPSRSRSSRDNAGQSRPLRRDDLDEPRRSSRSTRPTRSKRKTLPSESLSESYDDSDSFDDESLSLDDSEGSFGSFDSYQDSHHSFESDDSYDDSFESSYDLDDF